MEKQDSAYLESLTQTTNVGFVGYRDYKESEAFKRYEAARAKLPTESYLEASGKPLPPKDPGKHGRFAACLTALFGLLYLALCIGGFFLTKIVGDMEIWKVLRSTDLIHNIMDLCSGKIQGVEIVACIVLTVAALLSVGAFFGGLIRLSGKGIGKVLKIGCILLFLCTVVTMACFFIVGSKVPMGFLTLILISALMVLCTSLSSNKAKEGK